MFHLANLVLDERRRWLLVVGLLLVVVLLGPAALLAVVLAVVVLELRQIGEGLRVSTVQMRAPRESRRVQMRIP